jgi:hypothetical protein
VKRDHVSLIAAEASQGHPDGARLAPTTARVTSGKRATGRWIGHAILAPQSRSFEPRWSIPKARTGHRTKTEHLATILLPNSVAANDTKRDMMDGRVKILKENSTP